MAAGSTTTSTATAAVTTTSASTVVASAYYVSPTGADTNNGLSTSAPFKTLEHAAYMMERTAIKTTYLLGGTYARTKPLFLFAADAGESWLAYPGQTPILDGGGTAAEAVYIGGSNITVRWLTIQNFAGDGIEAQNVSGALIDSNSIRNIYSTTTAEGGIATINSFVNSKITHNSIQNVNYGGIVDGANVGDSITNLLIDSNVVYNTCRVVADCGAIHADDRGHASTGVIISNNIVGGTGPSSLDTRGIYLDDLLSNVKVRNNIVYGVSNYDIAVHGGDHNTFTNNIFDMSSTSYLGFYQTDVSSYVMSSNLFTCNIIYSSSGAPLSLWHYVGTGTLPQVSTNLYWKTSGLLPNLGAIIDTQPFVKNPNFINAAAANYTFAAGAPAMGCTFVPINTSKLGPLPNT